MSKLRVGQRCVEITNEEKLLFPKITKVELIEYYHNIAKVMLPYIKDRPISMHRFPNGIKKESFFQKEAGKYFPGWIKQKAIKKEGGVVHHVICNDAATLVYLANQACITVHTFLSKVDKIKFPDRLIFDLDPPANKFKLACGVAKELRSLLEEELLLKSFVMTTGSKGLHVVVPLRRTKNFDAVRKFAREVAKAMTERNPQVTTEQRKNKRRGRLYIDIMRNAYAQTAVAPYSVRALPRAPVATPVYWEELNSKLTPTKYNIKNIFKRLGENGDPWKGIMRYSRSLNL